MVCINFHCNYRHDGTPLVKMIISASKPMQIFEWSSWREGVTTARTIYTVNATYSVVKHQCIFV